MKLPPVYIVHGLFCACIELMVGSIVLFQCQHDNEIGDILQLVGIDLNEAQLESPIGVGVELCGSCPMVIM